jgi:hypothetical protein
MLLERTGMAAHDREDLFRRHFKTVLEEMNRAAALQLQIIAKREAQDIHIRNARAEVFHVIEV